MLRLELAARAPVLWAGWARRAAEAVIRRIPIPNHDGRRAWRRGDRGAKPPRAPAAVRPVVSTATLLAELASTLAPA